MAITLGILISICLIFIPMIAAFDSEKRRSEAKDRRMAEHRMNARLLRLDI
jgi:hypothetical protein